MATGNIIWTKLAPGHYHGRTPHMDFTADRTERGTWALHMLDGIRAADGAKFLLDAPTYGAARRWADAHYTNQTRRP